MKLSLSTALHATTLLRRPDAGRLVLLAACAPPAAALLIGEAPLWLWLAPCAAAACLASRRAHRLLRDASSARENREAMQLALAETSDAVITLDHQGCIAHINPAAEQLIGAPAAEALAQPGARLFQIGDASCKALTDALCLDSLSAPMEVARLWRRNGQCLQVAGSAWPVMVAGRPRGAVLLVRPAAIQPPALPDAQRDSLTGLQNHTTFHAQLTRALKRAHRSGRLLAVYCIGSQRIEQVNCSLGHLPGDQLLLAMAQRLTAAVREEDALARLNGSEFALLCEGVEQPEDAARIARHLTDVLSPPFRIDGEEIFLCPTIGICISPAQDDDAAVLLRNAHAAMLAARPAGREPLHFWSADMNDRALARLKLENALRYGLERGEFRLHYQPRVGIASCQVNGIEALLRWQHPQRGLVAPGEFISIMEESGLILEVGEWVLREACLQQIRCLAEGFDLCVSVNLSALQLKQPDFPQTVATILRETGINPQRLEFELTETLLMTNSPEIINALTQFREMGIRLSIDDFGTGWSSLSYLKRFPIDTLKIDQSFVRELTRDPGDSAIVRAIIAMADSLRLTVLAEGVETADQLIFLRNHGCDEVQGYWLSRPLPPKALLKWIRKHSGTAHPRC